MKSIIFTILMVVAVNVSAENHLDSLFGCNLGDTLSTGTTLDSLFGPGTACDFDGIVGGGGVIIPPPVNSVPVPAAVWLFGSGLIGMVMVARRRNA